MVKWQFLIDRLGALIGQEGKKLVLLNVEAMRNPKKQFKKYNQTVESVRNRIECVVTTSLPGEERVFWPYNDVQFYIRDGKDAISSTGNPIWIQKVFSHDHQDLNTTLPGMDFWKGKNFVFKLDLTNYLDQQEMLAGKVDIEGVVNKFGFRNTRDFDAKEWWYILKFYFIASEFQNLEGIATVIGDVPNNLKIKCDCQSLMDVDLFLKGIFSVPEQQFKHEYYLYISPECESCEKKICIYRPRGPFTPHLFVFMNDLLPSKDVKMTDIEMVSMWQDAFKMAAIKNMEKFQQIYSDDIIKFGKFFMEMERKYNK